MVLIFMPKNPLIKTRFHNGNIETETSDQARDLFETSRYGVLKGQKVNLAITEAVYLLEKEKIEIYDGRNHKLTYEELIKKAIKQQPDFFIRYSVFKNLRERGYIVKTALKFGADFRVYERGVKPGEDHAKWVVFPVYETKALTWYDFSAKNRVAHSTKKRLLIGVVDDEDDVSYWECKWIRP